MRIKIIKIRIALKVMMIRVTILTKTILLVMILKVIILRTTTIKVNKHQRQTNSERKALFGFIRLLEKM